MIQIIFFWHLMKRIIRAFKVLFLLIRDRDLVRALPWHYLKNQLRRSGWLIWQQVGLVGIYLAVPIGFVLGSGLVMNLGLWSWAAALPARVIRDIAVNYDWRNAGKDKKKAKR